MSLRREPAPAVARGALLALALTPLAADAGVLFPFVSPKALLLRAGIAVAAIALFVGVIRSEAVRAEIGARFSLLRRHPLAIANAALLAAFLLSAVFGVQPYRAFFGDAERGEGFVTSAMLAGYFLLAALVFDRKTWTLWLWLTIGVGGVLFAHALWQWSAGVARPASFTGHAAYLGPYALFVIGAAVIAAGEAASHGSRLRTLALAAFPMALATILLSETRAAMLGAIVGGTAVLVLVALRGARRLAVTVIVVGVAAATLFFGTRDAAVWHSIPGVARVAAWSGQDATTLARLDVWSASLAALSPRESGWHRVAFGWGLESFHVPFNRHYTPRLLQYDHQFYDRSHNKLLDIAVMAGLVGLLSYLAVWGAFFATTLRTTAPMDIQGALLFVGIAYFVQNLVSFDSFTTYVPLFGLWAFAAMLPASAETDAVTLGRAPSPATDPATPQMAVGLIGVIAVMSATALALQTLPAYLQMRRYVAMVSIPKTPTALLADWERVREPYSYVQPAIRADLVPRARVFLRQDLDAAPILAAAITAMDETVRRDTLEPRHLLALAEALGEYGDAGGSAALHETALQHLQRARVLAPNRAQISSAIALAEVRLACTGHATICYYEWLAVCVAARDIHGATLVRERLELLDPPRRALLADLGRHLRSGRWEAIQVAVTGTNVTITLAPIEP